MFFEKKNDLLSKINKESELYNYKVDSIFPNASQIRAKLYYRYNTYSCQACLEKTIDIIKTTLNVRDDYDKIVIIGNFINHNEFLFLRNQFDGKIKIIENKKSSRHIVNITLEKLFYSYFFKISEDGSFIDVFIPDKNEPELSKIYLEDSLNEK